MTKREQFIKSRHDLAQDGLRRILADASCRAWLWELLEQGGPLRNSWVEDPHVASFNAGARNSSIVLMSKILMESPDSYALMAREAKPPEDDEESPE